jgi:hypothetical protein
MVAAAAEWIKEKSEMGNGVKGWYLWVGSRSFEGVQG